MHFRYEGVGIQIKYRFGESLSLICLMFSTHDRRYFKSQNSACWPCGGLSEVSCCKLLPNIFLHLDTFIANGLHLFKASEYCCKYQLIQHIFCGNYRTSYVNIWRWLLLSLEVSVYHPWCLAHGTLSVDLTPRFWS